MKILLEENQSPRVVADLDSVAVVVFLAERVRVRRLPFQTG